MTQSELITVTARGLYCAAGYFYIDPWQPVERALITHAHGDHLRAGSSQYHLAASGVDLARLRLPAEAAVHGLNYGESVTFGDTGVSLHPAGRILGPSQIRVERAGVVWVVSGDYKRDPDPTCLPFEVVPCDVFISEATFALPACRWTDTPTEAREILSWWQDNRRRGLASVLFAYALGKAQRVLAELAKFTDEAVYLHGAVAALTDVYRALGISMLETRPATAAVRADYAGALILDAQGVELERFGTVRSVAPAHLFELAFEGIARSSRHKSGIALRFPRIVRWRTDKPVAEANTLCDLQRLLSEPSSDDAR